MGVRTISSRVATAGLVGLVALDVVLVGVALQSNDASPADTSPVSLPTVSPSPTGDAEPSTPASETPSSPPATSSTTAPPATTLAPLRTIVVALDNLRAWRVNAASCSAGRARLARTTDGGKTWVDAKAPLRTIVRVRPTDAATAFVIGAGSGCTAELKSTGDGGDTWASSTDVGRAWFRDPKDPRVLGAPGSVRSEPCGSQSVLDLVVLSGSAARVLCADGRVRSTANTALSWTNGGKLSGAVALAALPASPELTYVVRANAAGCAGVEVRRIDRSRAISCIAAVLPKGPGQISLSLVDGAGWLAIGDRIVRSTDGLATWS